MLSISFVDLLPQAMQAVGFLQASSMQSKQHAALCPSDAHLPPLALMRHGRSCSHTAVTLPAGKPLVLLWSALLRGGRVLHSGAIGGGCSHHCDRAEDA